MNKTCKKVLATCRSVAGALLFLGITEPGMWLSSRIQKAQLLTEAYWDTERR
jgi:hypothetical protein